MKNDLSDKISFRVSKELKEKLKQNAKFAGISLTDYIIFYLENPIQEALYWDEYQTQLLEFKKKIASLNTEKLQLQEQLKQSIPLSKIEAIKREVKENFHSTYCKEIAEAYEMGYKDGSKDRSK